MLMAGAIAAAVLVPRLGGGTPFTILTGSMQPGMPPGTLVVVTPVSADEIGIGTIVTYQLNSGEHGVVTHRVVSIGYDGSGQKTFTTQGDANTIPDARPVLPVQIRGQHWYHVRYLGYVSSAITGSQRHMATLMVAAGLLIYAAYMLTGAAKDRFRKTNEKVHHE